MSHTTEYTLPMAYYRGRASREAKDPKTPPATLTWGERHWWLAGWNDRDMEMPEIAPYAAEARLLIATKEHLETAGDRT